jgi:hypothetical protein
MAKMLPSFIPEDAAPGEKLVFNKLSHGPADWVVLHSLDLTPWDNGRRREIDFVVIVPDTGILCLEVKSHLNISFDGATWHPKSIQEKGSPFKQATGARHALYKRLSHLLPELSHVPMVHSCIFPQSRFDCGTNLGLGDWELLDQSQFEQCKTGEDFCKVLKLLLTKGRDAEKRQPLPKALNAGDIEKIVHACLPISRRRPDARVQIEQREKEMERFLRQQQKPILQMAMDNDRLLVSGGAGTGKTLVAMELARRQAERGHRVGLLCYNVLVGNWVTEKMGSIQPLLPNLVVGRVVKILADMSGVTIPSDPPEDYWDQTFPDLIEEAFTSSEFAGAAQFDYLILDEAQDVMARPRLWHSLGLFLNGGYSNGGFAMFGDFTGQVLGGHAALKQTFKELGDSVKPARYVLRENCRNYKIIGETSVSLAGMAADTYSGFMRQHNEPSQLQYLYYESPAHQLELIRKILKDAAQQGYKANQSTLVSFIADPQSAANSLLLQGYQLAPARDPHPSRPSYCTVHAYKGMENKNIIITDIQLNGAEFQRHLLYTAMTRATERVHLLIDKNSQQAFLAWVMEGLKNG